MTGLLLPCGYLVHDMAHPVAPPDVVIRGQ
jgi:hypothetical protein